MRSRWLQVQGQSISNRTGSFRVINITSICATYVVISNTCHFQNPQACHQKYVLTITQVNHPRVFFNARLFNFSIQAGLTDVKLSLMVNQEGNERTILIVGVFFGVLALCIVALIICCLYWRRQLQKERASGRGGFGYNDDLDRNPSTTGATSQIEM